MDQEVAYIWGAPWSFGKILYLLNKYYALSAAIFNNYIVFTPNLTDNLCLNWFRWQGATGIITFALTELILSFRLYALWALDKKVLAIMIVVFTAALSTSAGLVGNGMAKITASSKAIPGLSFCTRSAAPTSFYRFWFPILLSESVLCALAVVRGLHTYRKTLGGFRRKQPLLEILVRDSVLYFLMVFATYLCSAIIFVTGTDTQMECVICFAVATASVMGNRLCLNIRSLAQDSTTSDIGASQDPLSLLTFNHTLPYLSTRQCKDQSVDSRDVESGTLSCEVDSAAQDSHPPLPLCRANQARLDASVPRQPDLRSQERGT